MPLLEEFGPNIWIAQGPIVNFFGYPYPTRMAVVQLSNASTWIWSPVALTPELKQELQDKNLWDVQHVVSPNKIHHLFLKEWQEAFPYATFYAPPGLKERDVVKRLRFDQELENELVAVFSQDISLVVFKGSFFMEEVVFYHKASKTVLIGDLIQRFPEEGGFMGSLMKMDGLVGKDGSTPREWRFSFLTGKAAAKRARDVIVKVWKPEKLVIAHGECVTDGTATEVVDKALGWLDKFHGLW